MRSEQPGRTRRVLLIYTNNGLKIARTKLLKQKYQGVPLNHLYQNSMVKTIILSGNTMFN